MIELVFGMKIDKSFPRKYLESSSCGDGFYESKGRGHYEHPGVDAEAVIGSEVRITEITVAHTIFYDLFESVLLSGSFLLVIKGII